MLILNAKCHLDFSGLLVVVCRFVANVETPMELQAEDGRKCSISFHYQKCKFEATFFIVNEGDCF